MNDTFDYNYTSRFIIIFIAYKKGTTMLQRYILSMYEIKYRTIFEKLIGSYLYGLIMFIYFSFYSSSFLSYTNVRQWACKSRYFIFEMLTTSCLSIVLVVCFWIYSQPVYHLWLFWVIELSHSLTCWFHSRLLCLDYLTISCT